MSKSISRTEAIKVFFRAIDHDDPYWDTLTEEFYDEATDSWPSQWDVGLALGFTIDEMAEAQGVDPDQLRDLL